MNIGDLFMRIVADSIEFEADLKKKAEKAGDEAGKTLGERMGASIKSNGVKLIGGALALAGGIAAKGILELQNITADFRAETGATADEADRAGKAINEMSGRNIQPMREIGATLTKVHTDLGLTGDAAEKVTERFLKFGRVTKRDAAEEVASFDDILDAWNLTAADSGPIMDALVLSHQRYGGVIADDEAALRDLAPALIAANETWQDGLALINLFKDSGADAATAVAGITKALTKVKSPEELQHLIADIIATEDPFLRAAKASDLFGAKAGPKLANVLKPGIDGLDAYVISAEDAAGATDKAAEVLDSTWGARFQQLIKAAGSAIIGFGNDWGGLATVIATTMTIAGSLGGGKFVAALSTALAAAWTAAAGSAVVTRAVTFASGKAATIYLTGLIAGDAIGAALTRAWVATGGRLLTAAGVSGAAAGRAFAIGAAAAIVAAPVATILVAIQIAGDVQAAKTRLAAQVTDVINAGTLQGLQTAKAALEAQIGSQKIFGIIPFQFAGEVTEMQAQVKRIDAAIAALGPTVSTAKAAASDLDAKASASFVDLSHSAADMRARMVRDANTIASKIKALTATLLGQATALIDGYYDPLIAQEELQVAKDTVAADTRARNATKAGSAERHQADLTLANSRKNLDQTRLNLLASGKLSAKDQKAWLSELQAKYKTATGAARTDIGNLIKKIHELQGVPTTVVNIIAKITSKVAKSGQGPEFRAHGGPVIAGHPYYVNENTPNSEIWTPSVSGRVESGATPAEVGGTVHVAIGLTPEAAAALKTVGYDERRVAGFLVDASGLVTDLQQLTAMK